MDLLLLPFRYRCDGLQLPQLDRIPATLGTRQEKQFLLDVRRQAQQVHDLADPRAAHVSKVRQLRMTAHRART